MSFEKTRKTASTMIVIGIVIAVFSLIALPKDSTEYVVGCMAGIAVMAAAVLMCIAWCKCPHCGRRIFFQVLSVKKCPHCRKDLSKPPKKSRSRKKNDYGDSSNSPRLR